MIVRVWDESEVEGFEIDRYFLLRMHETGPITKTGPWMNRSLVLILLLVTVSDSEGSLSLKCEMLRYAQYDTLKVNQKTPRDFHLGEFLVLV